MSHKPPQKLTPQQREAYAEEKARELAARPTWTGAEPTWNRSWPLTQAREKARRLRQIEKGMLQVSW